MPIKCVVWVMLGLLICGCKTQPDQSAFDTSLVSPEIMGLHGEQRLAVLLYPDRVHSFCVEPIDRSDQSDRTKDYRIVTQGPDLTQDQIDHLRRLYIDMRGYGMLREKELERYYPPQFERLWGTGCPWRPDIVLEYCRGDQKVRVVICFGCSMWAFDSDGKRYGQFGFAEDKRTTGLQPMLRATVVELFPETMNLIPTHRY